MAMKENKTIIMRGWKFIRS